MQNPSIAWLETWMPKLRCPDTMQPLRWATPEECTQFGIDPTGGHALARQDGSRVFVIDDGIPLLLPESAPSDA